MSLCSNRPPERLTGRRSNEIPDIGDYLVPQANKGSGVYNADLIKHNKTPADMLIRLQESSAPNKRAIFRVPRKVNSITHGGLITKIVNEVKEKLRSLGVATALSTIASGTSRPIFIDRCFATRVSGASGRGRFITHFDRGG
jgi:hypothetical protein